MVVRDQAYKAGKLQATWGSMNTSDTKTTWPRTRSRCGAQVKPISQLTRREHRKQSKQQSEQNTNSKIKRKIKQNAIITVREKLVYFNEGECCLLSSNTRQFATLRQSECSGLYSGSADIHCRDRRVNTNGCSENDIKHLVHYRDLFDCCYSQWQVFSPTAAGHWCRSRWCLLQGEQLKSSIILVA